MNVPKFFPRNGYWDGEHALPGQEMVILDFDGGYTIGEAMVDFEEFVGAIATTSNHLREKHGVIAERFRLLLPTDKPVMLDVEGCQNECTGVRELNVFMNVPKFFSRKRVVISIRELLDGAGVRSRFNKTNHEFAIASSDELESLKGQNIGSAGINEPFIQQKQVFDSTLSRERHPRAKHREIFLTGTPEQLNWGHEVE